MVKKVYPQRRNSKARRVGLIYDERMCRHFAPDGEPHVENPDRIKAIWNTLESAGITQRCMVFNAEKAEDKYIFPTHTKKHSNLIRTVSSRQSVSERDKSASKFNSIYFNEGSSEAAYLAAGSVIEVAERVAKGELNSAFAIVRPPGHHAEKNEPMGFCLFNNVAIAASFLLDERPELGIKKILIVDWDVHHGNGTQKMFWKDPRVLVFSVHRHDFGTFYPANDDGCHTMIGKGAGKGYNVNVPWEGGGRGDADYLAVWEHILIPIAKDFDPNLIIISAGFDAAVDDPLGGCYVTPCGYSIMLNQLMKFAQGKIVMALEGGYNLDSLANSVLACVEGLLDDKPRLLKIDAYPLESTWSIIKTVREQLSTFWPVLEDELPNKSTSCKAFAAPAVAKMKSKLEGADSKMTAISEDMDSLKTSMENIELFVSDSIKRLEALLSDSRRYFVEMMKVLGDQIASSSTNAEGPPVSHSLPPHIPEYSDDEDEGEDGNDDEEEKETDSDHDDEIMDTLTSFDVPKVTCDDDHKLPDFIAQNNSVLEYIESRLTALAQDTLSLKTSVTSIQNYVSDSMRVVENLASDYHCSIVETMKSLGDGITSQRKSAQASLVSHHVPLHGTKRAQDKDDGDDKSSYDNDKLPTMDTRTSFDMALFTKHSVDEDTCSCDDDDDDYDDGDND